MTGGREFRLPGELLLVETGANAVVRPRVVAPKQSCSNEININRQLPFQSGADEQEIGKK